MSGVGAIDSGIAADDALLEAVYVLRSREDDLDGDETKGTCNQSFTATICALTH